MAALARTDARLDLALRRGGHRPVILREPGFASFCKIILEQQVSLAAAARMYGNLRAACQPLEPKGFLTLDEATLRACGFSRQKIAYARGLAEALLAGDLDLSALAALPDEEAIGILCGLKGIGPWSAQNYLLWSHGRRDIFPTNDLALLIGWQWLAGLEARPTVRALDEQALDWAPRRTAAAFLIWHYYLEEVDARRASGRRASKRGAAKGDGRPAKEVAARRAAG